MCTNMGAFNIMSRYSITGVMRLITPYFVIIIAFFVVLVLVLGALYTLIEFNKELKDNDERNYKVSKIK